MESGESLEVMDRLEENCQRGGVNLHDRE